jgi:methyl acetate hydrolase
LFNSYFWIDRENDLFGVFATQVLPFMDTESVAALTAFERALYGIGD